MGDVDSSTIMMMVTWSRSARPPVLENNHTHTAVRCGG